MKDWSEYIEQKFVPKENYFFEHKEEETPYGTGKIILSTITITHKKTKTWFYFQNWGDWKSLLLIEFGNPKTKCCPQVKSIYYDDVFDDETFRIMEESLKPSFTGWSVSEYYLFKKYIMSRYWNNAYLPKKAHWIFPYSSGCLYRLLSAFGIIFFYLRIIGKRKLVVIEGINLN